MANPKVPFLERLALDQPQMRGWAMYDWANSAFMTTIITAVFPLYFLEHVSKDVLVGTQAEGRFTLTTTIALVISAILAPILGTLADLRAQRKRYLTVFALIGIFATCGMFLIQPGDWLLALILFGVANVGAAGSIVFYDALLPHLVSKEKLDQLSTSGFALGYLGGGLLLAANLLLIQKPELFGLQDASPTLPTRIALLSVGIWWFVFTIPLWRQVPEPPATEEDGVGKLAFGPSIVISIKRLRSTLSHLRALPQATLLLIAFLIYNDGITTIIRMAALFSSSAGFELDLIIGTILMIQFLGVPFALLFGRLASRFGAKRMILLGLGVYMGICVLAYFMTTPTHFVALGVLVAMVQGGTQALSRSMFASMIPANKSGEFFAFFAVGEKFAGILGPSLYGLMIYATGSNRQAILSVSIFFLIGGTLLYFVKPEEGRRQALAAEDA
jgi:UMF1 family MFS transporter